MVAMTPAQARVGIVLVTHGQLGRCLLDTLGEMIGELPLPTQAVAVRSSQDPDSMIEATRAAIAQLGPTAGVLLLTDAFGSTPSNIAVRSAAGQPNARVLAGLNLPMLVRIYNYPQLNLEAMTESALQGGRQGILCGDSQHAPS